MSGLERTREALEATRKLEQLFDLGTPFTDACVAELDDAEAVIQAARNCVRGVDEQLRMSMGNSPYVSLYDLRAALRALDGDAP